MMYLVRVLFAFTGVYAYAKSDSVKWYLFPAAFVVFYAGSYLVPGARM